MKIKVSAIDWETDGQDPEELGLPQTVELTVDSEEQISNALSDKYGWLTNKVTYDIVPEPTNTITGYAIIQIEIACPEIASGGDVLYEVQQGADYQIQYEGDDIKVLDAKLITLEPELPEGME